MPAINGNGAKIRCDVHNGRSLGIDSDTNAPIYEAGCGRFATIVTDGTEVDEHTTIVNAGDPDEPERGKRTKLGRKAIPGLYVCGVHKNWPHSNDAALFAKSATYINRQAAAAAPKGGK